MADIFTNVHCCVQFHRLFYMARCAFRNPLLTMLYDSVKFDTMIVRLLNDAIPDTEVIYCWASLGLEFVT
jgi:hypothetical protein